MVSAQTRRPTKKALRKAEKRRRRLDPLSPLPLVALAPRAESTIGFRLQALLYLAALAAAEVLTTVVDTRWGVVAHALILVVLIARAAAAAYRAAPGAEQGVDRLARGRANFLVALTLAPLIRVVSLAMPLNKFPELTWYGLVALPLLAAAWSAANACGYDRRALGLRLDARPLPLAITYLIGVSGAGLGYVEYRILRPDPLIDRITPLTVLAAAVVLLVGTGFTEELIFRGVLQRAGEELFGAPFAIGYASTVFAVLHIGQRSPLDVGFVFLVAVGFALLVRRTGSLAGVTLAHGTTNFFLFVVFPHLLG